MEIKLEKIKRAADRLAGVINTTDLMKSSTFSSLSNNQIYLKPENLQRTGSFKIRGAYNKIANLTVQEKEAGVIASSAGNHAQGVALAATEQEIKSTIVMPKQAPIAKVTATKNYGAEVILDGQVYDDAYDKAKQVQEKTGATFIHPFNDSAVIAGQGTIGLEILAELSEVDTILVPIGGGGLVSGIASAVKKLKPEVKIIGVEAQAAASMKSSLSQGQVSTLSTANTIADGIAVKRPGGLTYDICNKYVDEIITVTDNEVAKAILMLLERSKLTVEGAGAVTVAAILSNKLSETNKNIVAVLSGGNIDFNMISRIIERGLAKAGRRIRLQTNLQDKPGSLQTLLAKIAELGANVISVVHHRHQASVALEETEVELELETRHQEHAEEICDALRASGYDVKDN
jgi:threonine dehydratase